MNTKGRVTIPTDMDAVPETLDLLKRWGADAIRDCDGTEFPQELKDTGAKIYATYYTTRKDNAWAKENPDETQQCYIMTPFYTAADGALTIPLMTGISRELMKVNDHDDIARWWEVIDRTTGEPLDAAAWHYDAATESVVIDAPAAYHEYTVSFLAYLIWDPVHMYNSVINDWKDVEHQIPFDVRQPKTHAYTMRRLREYLESHPYVNVVRFTTFFHLFTLVFDELRREKYVDWYGYSASVSPYILEQFEKEVGYKFNKKPWMKTMMTVDDTLGDWKLGTTTKEAFTQKCGEGTATETVYNYTIGMDMEKVTYDWGYACFARLRTANVLVELYMTRDEFTAPRKTQIGSTEDEVVSVYKDFGQVESPSGNRGLYESEFNKGKIYKQEDGTKIIRYRVETGDSHIWQLDYELNTSGTVDAIRWSYEP